MIINRRTLEQECVLEGKGLHSGEPVTIRISPSETGIQFQHGTDKFDALPANVTDTSRCTVIGTVRTVEHIMSAFAACQITDALVELSYPELPGLDGSSLGFFNALSDAGFQEIGTREVADIYSRLFVQNDQIKIAVGKGTGHWRFDFVTDARWPGEMTFESLDILREYQSEVAPARTTVFADEIDQVKAAGLGRGLDESSVLIIGESGYENNARFKDEPARHKLLDLIGDLYLSGIPIELLNVVGYRSGHRRNIEMAKLIFDSCQTP